MPIKDLIERWIQGSDTCSLNKADAAIFSSCLLPPACQTLYPTKECMEQGVWTFGSRFSAKSCGLAAFPGHVPFHLQMAKPWPCTQGPQTEQFSWLRPELPVLWWDQPGDFPKCAGQHWGSAGAEECASTRAAQVLRLSTHIPPNVLVLISRPSCFLLPLCQAIAPHNCWQNTARASSLCSLGKIRQLNHLLNYLNLMSF